MSLLNTLSYVIQASYPLSYLLEVSQKIKNQLVSKFKEETQDDEEIIGNLVDVFDNYKSGLPVEKRDLLKYSYSELKNLIGGKQLKKDIKKIFKFFKKKEDRIDNTLLTNTIRKFLEIKESLPQNKRDITRYKFLDLVGLVDDQYPQLLHKIALEKFKKENPEKTPDQLLFYINAYIQHSSELPADTPSILTTTFTELEHLIDGFQTELGPITGKKDYSGIEKIYDDDNMLIFNPQSKDQCITLRNGRSWCTSREGGSNLYYNYRLDNNKTLYYVIDEDKDFSDTDFAVVILVDKWGGKALADGTNSGKYSGHSNIRWDEIVSKLPKLKGKENLFVAKPLTDSEKEVLRKYGNLRVGDDPLKELGSEEEVEMWLEIQSPNLSAIQYSNITPPLKKKYIALGMELNSQQLQNSEPEIVQYYINKKVEELSAKSIQQLNTNDIALLKLGLMKTVREELKDHFSEALVQNFGNKVDIRYPTDNISKFVSIYGFDEFFDSLPSTLTRFDYTNTPNRGVPVDSLDAAPLHPKILNFPNLEILHLENVVNSLPEDIGKLTNLKFLSLEKNSQLKSLPASVANLPNLEVINLRHTPATIPPLLQDRIDKGEIILVRE